MRTSFDVAVLVGSLRRESYTRCVANALIQMAPAGLRMSIVEIGQLQLYNPDLEDHLPVEWARFRERIKAADAVVFTTPEYNRSLPGALKNAVDVGSRPYGQSAWNGKPAGIISTSPGALGGFGANHHLRQCLVFLNMPTLQQPEAYLGGIASCLNQEGEVKTESVREFLRMFAEEFAEFMDRLVGREELAAAR